MIHNIPAIMQHRHTTKFFAILIGYSLWFTVAQHQATTKTIQTQIYLYDAPDTISITDLPTITVTLQASGHTMYYLHPDQVAVHVDASKLKIGANEIVLDKENLFLPDSIKLIDLIPSHITIHANLIEKT